MRAFRQRAQRIDGDVLPVEGEHFGITRELGSALWTPGALGELGADLNALGEASESERLLQAAIDGAGEATQFVVLPLLTQTDCLLGDGQFEAALEKAQRTCALAPEYAVFALHTQAQQGQALLALGRFDEGERILREVQTQARSIGAAPALWQACLALADHLSAHGRVAEAASERAEALAKLEQSAAELPDDLRRSFMDMPVMSRARAS